jgi:competence protein ComEA
MKRALSVGLLLMGFLIAPGSPEAKRREHSGMVTGVVNLNKASPAQLEMLPGVKAKAAEKIIAHREKQPFSRVEELVNVKGFSKRRFERLKPFLSVAGETTIKVEKAAKKVAHGHRGTGNPHPSAGPHSHPAN